MGQDQGLPGSCSRHIHLFPFVVEELLLLLLRLVLAEVGIREVAFTEPHDKDMVPFQPLGGVDGGDGQEISVRGDVAILVVLAVERCEGLLVRGESHQVVGYGMVLPGEQQQIVIILLDGLVIMWVTHDPFYHTGRQGLEIRIGTVFPDGEDKLTQLRGEEPALALPPVLHDVYPCILGDLADAVGVLVVEDAQDMVQEPDMPLDGLPPTEHPVGDLLLLQLADPHKKCLNAKRPGTLRAVCAPPRRRRKGMRRLLAAEHNPVRDG